MLINLYLIGGLFLGWSLGRNNLSNLFGAAIFTRMVQPKTATFIAIVFVVLGAVFGGYVGIGARAHDVGRLYHQHIRGVGLMGYDVSGHSRVDCPSHRRIRCRMEHFL